MTYLDELKALDSRDLGTRAYCDAMASILDGTVTEEQYELIAFESNARKSGLRRAFDIKSRWRAWRRAGLGPRPQLYVGAGDRLFAGPNARRSAELDRWLE
jgi:hypothetical protein